MVKVTFANGTYIEATEVNQSYSQRNPNADKEWALNIRIEGASMSGEDYLAILESTGALDRIVVENENGDTHTFDGYTNLSFLDVSCTDMYFIVLIALCKNDATESME